MQTSNRNGLPAYCQPHSFLPTVQRAGQIFSSPPYLFQDFVGQAIAFLRSDRARKWGFEFSPEATLPCKWKCSDESLFGVDLCLYTYTGQYPFDKGMIGGAFNEASVAAAVHHAETNIDFGGSHVGYLPGADGGTFGRISRPLYQNRLSDDCGHLAAVLQPFLEIYRDACDNILISKDGDSFAASIPNEFLQPSWSRNPVKLLVDLESFTTDLCSDLPPTAGRSQFRLHPEFIASLDTQARQAFRALEPTPVRAHLQPAFFNLFDTTAELDPGGTPEKKLLPYMKHIVADRQAPPMLTAALINTNIEYNRLCDCIRLPDYTPYAFACFPGVFIDLYDPARQSYVNLFQPIGLSFKPAGKNRDLEFNADQTRELIEAYKPADPVQALEGVLGYDRPDDLLDQFTFKPKDR